MNGMDGEVELLNGTLAGELIVDLPTLSGEILPVEDSLSVLEGEILLPSSDWGFLPEYDGTYEITPLVNTEQLLETEGKRMADDLVILAVPYYETTNESGGYTVIIG